MSKKLQNSGLILYEIIEMNSASLTVFIIYVYLLYFMQHTNAHNIFLSSFISGEGTKVHTHKIDVSVWLW